jgi:hypothetical protein
MRPVRQKWVGQRFLPRRHKIPGPPAAQIAQIRAIIGNGVTTKAAVPNGGSVSGYQGDLRDVGSRGRPNRQAPGLMR